MKEKLKRISESVIPGLEEQVERVDATLGVIPADYDAPVTSAWGRIVGVSDGADGEYGTRAQFVGISPGRSTEGCNAANARPRPAPCGSRSFSRIILKPDAIDTMHSMLQDPDIVDIIKEQLRT
jgi:hypothetical protein